MKTSFKLTILLVTIIFMIQCSNDEELIMNQDFLQGTWVEVEPDELIQYEGDNYQFTFSQDSFFAEIHYWTDVIMDTCSIIDWTYKINGKYVVSLDSIEFTGIISTVPDNCDTITHKYNFHKKSEFYIISESEFILDPNPEEEYYQIRLVKK